MNLLSFLAITIHPPTHVSWVQILFRYPGQRSPVSGVPTTAATGTVPGLVAPLAVALHAFPGTQLGLHVAISTPHVWALVQLWVSLQLLSVAPLKIEWRIRSLQQFLLADAFNTSLATGFSRRCTEGCGCRGVFLEVVHQLPQYFRALAASPHRVKWPFPCCSFLGVSVVSWLCCCRTAEGSPTLRSLTPAPGHAGVSPPLLWTPPVQCPAELAQPRLGVWVASPSWCCSCAALLSAGLGSTLRPDKKLLLRPKSS